MRLFPGQSVIEKTSGKTGVVRTAYDERRDAVVNFNEGGAVGVLPYRRLRVIQTNIKVIRCISDKYSNFIQGKIYAANSNGNFGHSVIDEDGDEFPVNFDTALTNEIFEEVE